MRILTLTQPWATLMAIGAKTIETRSWGTNYRGPVAIHASKAPPNLAVMLGRIIQLALKDRGYEHGMDLPRGRIVAVVELVDVLKMAGVYAGRCARGGGDKTLCLCGTFNDHALTRQERAFGRYEAGRRAWITDPAKLIKLREPILWKGAQGLREIDPVVAARLGLGVA